MLHRMMLRVLPNLAVAVTDEEVRKRKRLVMLVAGLVAFAVYRVAKVLLPLSDPLVLVGVSGLLGSVTAAGAFLVGRGTRLPAAWREDGFRLIAWLAGWIGAVWGLVLSLLVLALLKVFLNYDFLDHPDGPAMMALIIACTSVARDAFEIGHVRRIQRRGDPIVTFPDGSALRTLVWEQPLRVAFWGLAGGVCGAAVAWPVSAVWAGAWVALVHLATVSVAGGCLAAAAYLAGKHPDAAWRSALTLRFSDLFRFWWWPGLVFAATYNLVLWGAAWFLLRDDPAAGSTPVVIAALVTGLMTVSCYYLGHRRHVEDRISQIVPASLLRCPFVMGILSKSRSAETSGEPAVLRSPAPESRRARTAGEGRELMGYK